MEEYEKQIAEIQPIREKRERKYEYAKQFTTIAVRVIDFYYPSNKKYRSIFIIQNKIQAGKILCSELQELGSGRRTIATETPPVSNETYQRLKSALELEIQRKKNGSTIVDDSFHWIDKPERFHPKKFLDLDRYPFSYELIDRKWKKYEPISHSNFQKPISHYFIPNPDIKPQNSKLTSSPTTVYSFLDREYVCEKCGKVTSDWVSSNGAKKTCICRECAYPDS